MDQRPNTSENLGGLLRSWRGRVRPEDAGLPFRQDSRRLSGLRREEVAWLAGVSVDYVKRLEQGRAHPSASVLRAIARALRLADAEYELACRLAGHAAERGGTMPRHIGASVRRMLDRLGPAPIAVYDASWTLLECNEPWTALLGGDVGRGGRAANLAWRYFTGDLVRVRHDRPEEYRASLVADLRDAASRYPADRELADLVTALRSVSSEFARLWDTATVAHHGNQRKTVDHPEAGQIALDCDVLTVHGADLRIVVFTAPPGSAAEEKLRRLAVLGSATVFAANGGPAYVASDSVSGGSG